MAIVHIVLFQFKPTVEEATVKDVSQRMLGLRQKCLHPTSNQPYIKASVGGKDNSPEGQSGGLSHGFVVEFDNEEDRDYYLKKDPAHLAFVKSLDGIIESVRILDFVPGVF